jgi:peptidoglycan/xylan/chitin deacetylase (PgdA/CDA1 family)
MKSAIESLKLKIAPGVHGLSYASGISRFQARRISAARVFMYHGVGGPYCPANVFESQMKYIKDNFTVISLKQAVEMSSDSNGRFGTEVVLTFDDGLRNNYTIAYPILSRYGLPATFFVCPGLIESQQWQWPYDIKQRLLSCNKSDLAIVYRTFEMGEPAVENDAGRGAVGKIISHMKTIKTDERQRMEKFIWSMTQNFKPTARQHDMYSTMNWEELGALSPDLITVGSHTVNHPILTNLTFEEMRLEIQYSRRWLEQRLNRPVEYFCYPNGDYDESTVTIVAENYKAAVTTRQGFFNKGDDVYQINRIPAPDGLPLFAWRMFRPAEG